MMNLDKRKALAAKVLGVGKNKIVFDSSRLADIKEAITKQDIRDMYADGTIGIKETRGRLKFVPRTTNRGPGKIKMKIKPGKTRYITLVRKFRRHVKELLKQGKIDKDRYFELRQQIRTGMFKNKANLKEHIGGTK
jgi:large subunit ribosomal protein L19e